MQEASVGYTQTKKHQIKEKIQLESGKKFGPIEVAYETYGTLNQEKNNAILVCHPLTGDAHAAGYHEGDQDPGWWDNMIGPGKAFDTEKYYVICSNVLGGCKGTTGPKSTNPETGEPYALDFPVITIKDMVKVQKKLIDHLGINKLFAVTGGSMGGMQALQWAVTYPEAQKFCIPIATTAKSSPQQIAFNEVGRRAIMSDPNWNQGNYYDQEPPKNGLSLARMIGHITYLSERSMRKKFGRRLQDKKDLSFDFTTDFEVESYLKYKGKSFVKRFDPNSYLYLTRAIDYFDLTDEGERTLTEALSKVKCKFLVVAITSDWLYPRYQSKEIVRALESQDIEVEYSEIRSSYGHDAFLLEPGQLKHLISSFLSKITVSDVLQRDIPLINKDTSIQKAAEKMINTGLTHLPVVEDSNKLVGLITAWDISKAVAENHESLEEIMTEKVITASENESIRSVVAKIRSNNISALPVVDEKDKVIGLVSSDILSQLADEKHPVPGTD
ncbi:MAG: Homoserine acetyltransferase MET2 [Candidatus Methanohalarchaeum thermophilum]|uniref:Homoserine O-acetyltransferase n=1 Tax=Methanohalarchaeum thermophilum TaxID=1903181 RepID=A0A1Q6DSL1_METT1|nr:MAG: Homoserine acetyltransferase MET2 [Candidatus Methanohalarchaeum thermophilum]